MDDIHIWQDMNKWEPEIKHLPFVTFDKDGNYELWEDSDWFQELTDKDKSKYVKWISVKTK